MDSVRVPKSYARVLSHEHLDMVLVDIDVFLARLRRDRHELLRRVKEAARDGFPTSTLGGGSGRGGVSDPVGELATSDPIRDPIRDTVREMCVGLLLARDMLRVADSARARSLPRDPEQHVEVPLAPGCSNCIRYGIWTIVFRAGRCRFCYDWRRRDPQLADAPEHEVLDHHERRRQRVDPGKIA